MTSQVSRYHINSHISLDYNKNNCIGSQIHRRTHSNSISISFLGLSFSNIQNSKIPSSFTQIFKRRITLQQAFQIATHLLRFRRFRFDSSIIREDNSDYITTALLLKASRIKPLEKLDCIIFPAAKLTSDGIFALCKMISKVRQLKKLSIAFNWTYQLIDHGIVALGSCLIKLRKLKGLNLSIFNCQNLTAHSLSLLGIKLRQKTALEFLSLTLGRASPQIASSLPALWEGLDSLVNLRKLNINLVTVEIPNASLKPLGEALLGMKQLEGVDFTFLRCTQVGNKGLQCLSKALKNLSNLKEIAINNFFCDETKENDFQEICEINVKELSKIALVSFKEKPKASASLVPVAKGLKSQLELRELKLYFGLNRALKKAELMELADSISLMSKLKKLNISMPFESKFDDKSLALLLNPISSLEELQEIVINLSNSLINDNSIYILSDYLNDRVNLKLLSLNFSDCLRLTDEAMMYIASTLVLLKSLETLRINVARCSKITEKGVACLGNALKSLRNLLELDIDLSLAQDYSMFMQAQTLLFHEVLAEVLRRTNANRTDNCIINLCVGLSELCFLKKLRISFKGCSFISDKGLTELSDAMLNMKMLTELDLDLQSCLGITNNTVEKLSAVLVKMKNLNTVNLVFLEDTEITDASLTHMFIRLEDIPVVIICSSSQTLLKPRLSLKILDLIALCK